MGDINHMREILPPCRMCGGAGVLYYNNISGYAHIECTKCGRRTFKEVMKACIHDWTYGYVGC